MFRALRLVRQRRPSVVLAVGGYASVACALAAGVLARAARRRRAERAGRARQPGHGTVRPRLRRGLPGDRPSADGGHGQPRATDDRRRVRGRRPRPRPPRARPAPRSSPGGRLLGLAGFDADQRGRRRRGGAVARPRRPGDPPRRRPAGLGRGSPRCPHPVGALVHQAVEYEDRMDLLLAAADLAVCRAGGSVAELAVMGVPAILVPLPQAPRDHQMANARYVADHGAAVVVPDAELDGARLVTEADAVLTDAARLERMRAAALAMARPDAADAVAGLLEVYRRG
ncbi:MAG: glycosyltransferase [Acidimicrobiia bacterium]|nr:glycosyltransferase [Acidimicrobiia bacterium]